MIIQKVVGVTADGDYGPCLARQTRWANARHNLALMRRAGLASPIIWVDVEPFSVARWSSSITAKRAVLAGVVRGYRSAGKRVGFYSTKTLWAGIVGSTRYRLPEWRTAGPRSMATARSRCAGSSSFQGGRPCWPRDGPAPSTTT